MVKLPAIQFYVGDWRKDPGIQALTLEERGLWLELLFFMHESPIRGKLILGDKPFPVERLARLLSLSPAYLEVMITSLIDLGVASRCPETGALMNRRMVRDARVSKKRSLCGKLGGNPNFQAGKSNPYYDKQKDKRLSKQKDKQKITPSSSSSSSSSSSDIKDPPNPPSGEGSDEPEIQRPRDKIWDFMQASFFPDGLPEPQRKRLGKAVNNLKGVGATPESIRNACRRYRETWPDAELTLEALVKHWQQFCKPLPGEWVPLRGKAVEDLIALADALDKQGMTHGNQGPTPAGPVGAAAGAPVGGGERRETEGDEVPVP